MDPTLHDWQSRKHREHVHAALRTLLGHGRFTQESPASGPIGSLQEHYLPRAVVHDLLRATRVLYKRELAVTLLQLDLMADGRLYLTYVVLIPATCPNEVPQHLLTGKAVEKVWDPQLFPDVHLDSPPELRSWLEEITSGGEHSLYTQDLTTHDDAAHMFLG